MASNLMRMSTPHLARSYIIAMVSSRDASPDALRVQVRCLISLELKLQIYREAFKTHDVHSN